MFALCAGLAGEAMAQVAVDPNRPVRGSCAEVLRPLFNAVAESPVVAADAVSRLDVSIATNEKPMIEGAVDRVATLTVNAADNFQDPNVTPVANVLRRAYAGTEQEGCVGVITGKSRWIIRIGPVARLWAPDQPTIMNAPVAATTLRDGRRIELVDPALGRSRLVDNQTSPESGDCHFSPPYRQIGGLPPVDALPRRERFNVRFRLEADGVVGAIRFPDQPALNDRQRSAVETYVRNARYYPQINAQCSAEASWVLITLQGRR